MKVVVSLESRFRSSALALVLLGSLLSGCASQITYDVERVVGFCDKVVETKETYFKTLNSMSGTRAWQVIEWSVALRDYWETLEPSIADSDFEFLAGSEAEEPVRKWWSEHSVFMVGVLDANQVDMDYSDYKWGYQIQVNGRNFDEVIESCMVVKWIHES